MKIVERNRYNDKGQVFQKRVLTFEPYSFDQIESVIKKIQENLSGDLLKGKRLKYADDVKLYQYYGHCYHSSQALFFMMDTDKLIPMSAVDWRDEKHWWLQCEDKIYDVTEDQYYSRSKTPPHESGKKSVWYGWKQRPQQITLDLMVRVLGDRLESDVIKN
tara:strand:- start:1653 stop:2135 length:483 start_codon:yes stop_codon:yes gene_type:complete